MLVCGRWRSGWTRRSGRRVLGWYLISRLQQLRDLDLAHAQHGLGSPLRPAWVRVINQIEEHGRHDLPRDTESVLEPPARPLLPGLGQSAQVVVDLVLVCAEDLEGDGLGEGELRPTRGRSRIKNMIVPARGTHQRCPGSISPRHRGYAVDCGNAD